MRDQSTSKLTESANAHCLQRVVRWLVNQWLTSWLLSRRERRQGAVCAEQSRRRKTSLELPWPICRVLGLRDSYNLRVFGNASVDLADARLRRLKGVMLRAHKGAAATCSVGAIKSRTIVGRDNPTDDVSVCRESVCLASELNWCRFHGQIIA